MWAHSSSRIRWNRSTLLVVCGVWGRVLVTLVPVASQARCHNPDR